MTKVISISDEAYDELKRIKNGFSFSKVIIELSKTQKAEGIMKLAGSITEEEGNRMLKEIKELRKKGSWRIK